MSQTCGGTAQLANVKTTRSILVMICDKLQPSMMSLKIHQQPKNHHGILMNSLSWDNLQKRIGI